MATYQYSAGTLNGLFSAVSLASGGSKNTAALVDLSTQVGGAIGCKVLTGGTAPTLPTTFSAFRVLGATAGGNTTLSAGAANGATSITVASATGLSVGQKIALITAAGKVGEIVTISAISGTTLTVSALQAASGYSSADLVFVVETTASGGVISPGYGSFANSTAYVGSLIPPPAFLWIIQAINTDTAQGTTVSATLDLNPTFS